MTDEKRKVTNASIFGALFGNAARRGIQAIELGDDAPDELKKMLGDVQEAIGASAGEEEPQVKVVSEQANQSAPIETTGSEVK